MCLAANERQIGDQRPDRRGLCRHKGDIDTPGCKTVCFGCLVNGARTDAADRSELLQRCAAWMGSARRIINEAVASVHSLEHTRFAVVELRISASGRDIDVILRYDAD